MLMVEKKHLPVQGPGGGVGSDLADGCVYLMNHFNAGTAKEDERMFVNIGTGEDIRPGACRGSPFPNP